MFFAALQLAFDWFARFDGCDLAARFLCAGLVSLSVGKGQGWHDAHLKQTSQSDGHALVISSYR